MSELTNFKIINKTQNIVDILVHNTNGSDFFHNQLINPNESITINKENESECTKSLHVYVDKSISWEGIIPICVDDFLEIHSTAPRTIIMKYQNQVIPNLLKSKNGNENNVKGTGGTIFDSVWDSQSQILIFIFALGIIISLFLLIRKKT